MEWIVSFWRYVSAAILGANTSVYRQMFKDTLYSLLPTFAQFPLLPGAGVTFVYGEETQHMVEYIYFEHNKVGIFSTVKHLYTVNC